MMIMMIGFLSVLSEKICESLPWWHLPRFSLELNDFHYLQTRDLALRSTFTSYLFIHSLVPGSCSRPRRFQVLLCFVGPFLFVVDKFQRCQKRLSFMQSRVLLLRVHTGTMCTWYSSSSYKCSSNHSEFENQLTTHPQQPNNNPLDNILSWVCE